ncbi:MAG TPA: VWA domain-containing protein [Euzebya sp.]|nr:VWA domain-containing protein [Euzebya sp.]
MSEPADSASAVPPSDDATTPAPTSTPGTRYPGLGEIEAQGTAALCDLVGEGFCVDDNDNFWPDVVDEAIGRDTSVDECLQSECAAVAVDEFLLSLQENTLFILDSSGSMAGSAGGGATKMDAAKNALRGYVEATPEFADLGLMVYGHQGDNSDAGRPESCAGIETFAEVGDLTPESVGPVLDQFQATGWTPIGAALAAAGPVLERAVEADVAEDIEGATNRVILISDGIETCDGDPVAAAQGLVDLGIEVVVDVIGFDLAEADRAALQQVAETTGGVYRDAQNASALQDALFEYLAQSRAAVGPIQCQLRAIADSTTCRNMVHGDANEFFFDLISETAAEGDSERAAFLRAWHQALSEEVREAGRLQTEQLRARLSEFQELLAEAQERARGAVPSSSKVSLQWSGQWPDCDVDAGTQPI